jgi:hypothetical protein
MLSGQNLVKWFGRKVGLVSHTIEIRNITVGDLPFDTRGDFYLSIECSTNPPMITALQEEKLPKVVHFPENLMLKVKDSFLEPRVRICVKELNVLGSNELCDVFLSSPNIVDWMKESNHTPAKPPQGTRGTLEEGGGGQHNIKRFQMRALDNSIERVTPPWIMVEFCDADDVREIEHDKGLAKSDMVRTWVPVQDRSVKAAGVPPPVDMSAGPPGSQAGGGMQAWRLAPRMNVDLKMEQFKGFYSLLDDSGNPIQEPEEKNLAKYKRKRHCFSCIFTYP